MDSLARLFGSEAKVKCLRLFLFNSDASYTLTEVAKRTRISRDAAKRESSILAAAGVLRKSKVAGELRYSINPRFKHLAALEGFLRATDGVHASQILTSLRPAGALRLVALSGFFTSIPEPKIDLLIVGDSLNERTLERAVHTLEAELGREIRYASFATADFRYRLGVYDRLIRDVIDYPHRILLDKIGI